MLRKNAYRVLNKIVRKDEVDRWTHVFFAFTNTMVDNVGNVVEKGSRYASKTAARARGEERCPWFESRIFLL